MCNQLPVDMDYSPEAEVAAGLLEAVVDDETAVVVVVAAAAAFANGSVEVHSHSSRRGHSVLQVDAVVARPAIEGCTEQQQPGHAAAVLAPRQRQPSMQNNRPVLAEEGVVVLGVTEAAGACTMAAE